MLSKNKKDLKTSIVNTYFEGLAIKVSLAN